VQARSIENLVNAAIFQGFCICGWNVSLITTEVFMSTVSKSTTIALHGLTPLEAEELKTELEKAGCELAATVQVAREPDEVGGSKKGEPFTMFAVIVVSQLALTALALYLAKGRSRVHKTERITIKRLNGETITHEIEIAADKEDAIRADLMSKIGQMRIPTA